LRGIVAFVRTVNAGSFSAAARQLGVTTVAVSRNVQRLERQLGVRLLQRTTRSLGMTEEGRRFFEATRNALIALEMAHEAVALRRHEPSGLVRILSPTGFSRLYVVPLLVAIRARYPRLQFELHASDRTVDMVEEGFDVGIRAGPVTDATVVVRKLTDIPRIICASPEYLARRGVPSSLESLSAHECIAYRSPSTGRIVKWEFTGEVPESYEPHAVLTLNDIFAVCDAAIGGHGLVQLPTFIATPPIRNGQLVPVFVDRESAPAHLVLQYPARPLTPARVRVVVDYLYENLHDHPDLTFDPRRIVSAQSPRVSADQRAGGAAVTAIVPVRRRPESMRGSCGRM
jgi:DNA-binding transcriptional LysR family regulator